MTQTTTYADGRRIFDADSHIMELPGWLETYADPDVRERIRPLRLGGAGAMAEQAIADAEQRKGDEAAAQKLEGELMTAKGWNALGAFDPEERARALDLLGFESQLVFPTFAASQFIDQDPELLMGGTRALNRAVAGFCADDDRLVGVGSVLWMGPELTEQAVEEALDAGCGTVMFPSHPGKGISPTHPDYDRVWSLLEDRDVPFMLHIGGGGRSTRPAFHDNGRPVTDFLGGGENIRSKDYITISHMPQQFLSAMVLDGIFEDHPRLRGGCIEQGAGWVVSWLRTLDGAMTFKKTEETLANLPMLPSEYVHRQLWFTPFPAEDVGWMIEQCGDDLFLFSSDYPHPEGTKNPIERFEGSLEGASQETKDRFYFGNYADMMGIKVPAAA